MKVRSIKMNQIDQYAVIDDRIDTGAKYILTESQNYKV